MYFVCSDGTRIFFIVGAILLIMILNVQLRDENKLIICSLNVQKNQLYEYYVQVFRLLSRNI